MFADAHIGWLAKAIQKKMDIEALISEMAIRGYPKANEKLDDEEGKGVFEVLEDIVPSNHKYFSKAGTQVNNARKILEEYKILGDALPSGIVVKGFTSNLNLLSAMIVGPKGTLCEDAVFIFDILFPTTYPSKPPKVHYHCIILID
ncbi:unnamed protein product [Cyprideis torosa]|uniref:Uncharacterized protein n=1 Tax=Cyprideis torosa TaxID=163714 RepID=A0A7R8W6E5_9CRUS|nr:unnamed protein product [Cyprideis torosa]CAG0886334.1 unnamed protein product [Cyprideis torosa]